MSRAPRAAVVVPPTPFTVPAEEWQRRMQAVHIRKEDLNAVVMNYLITEGYAQAAAQFQEESRTAAGLDLSTVDARMEVHAAVLRGDCGAALEGCNSLDPSLLEARKDLLFALHRQHLVELIRRGDVDAALGFAQEYLAPLALENPEFRPELERAMALLAFENEAQAAAVSPSLAALWAPEARVDVASRLNAAILVSQGQESEPRLPGLLKRLAWTEKALTEAGKPAPQVELPAWEVLNNRIDDALRRVRLQSEARPGEPAASR